VGENVGLVVVEVAEETVGVVGAEDMAGRQKGAMPQCNSESNDKC
jgi:hypothetical protein